MSNTASDVLLSARDISVTFGKGKRAFRAVKNVSFDIYRGEKLGADKKSIAFALSFRAADRTLTDAEINAALDKILTACARDFGAELRR